jgi:uncharacterized tellurite resistance protein B-like protein
MRHYTTDSAEAMSRVVALALLADGALDHSELESLASHEIHNRLRIAPETLDRVIHEFCNDLLQCARAPNIGQIELDREMIDHLLDDIRSPEMQREALGAILDIVNADGCLNGGEAILISEAMNLWGLERDRSPDPNAPQRRRSLPRHPVPRAARASARSRHQRRRKRSASLPASGELPCPERSRPWCGTSAPPQAPPPPRNVSYLWPTSPADTSRHPPRLLRHRASPPRRRPPDSYRPSPSDRSTAAPRPRTCFPSSRTRSRPGVERWDSRSGRWHRPPVADAPRADPNWIR